MGQVALPFLAHFGEDMAFVSVFSFYLPCARERESLLGAGIGFHFWHRMMSYEL